MTRAHTLHECTMHLQFPDSCNHLHTVYCVCVVCCEAHKDLHNEMMEKSLAEREAALLAKLIEAEAVEKKKEEVKAAAAKAKEEAAKAKEDAVCVCQSLLFVFDRLIVVSCCLMHRNGGIRVVKCNARQSVIWSIKNSKPANWI